MISFKITVQDLRFRSQLRRATRLFDDLKPEMDVAGKYVVWDGRRRLGARGSQVSIGRLGKSLKHQAFKKAAVVSSALPYARIQQHGGTVRPRKRKALAIPLQPDLARKHVWPKHYTGKRLALVRINDILWEKRVKTGELVRPAFVLKKQVQIKGRPYLVKSPELITLLRRLMVRKLHRFERGSL